MTVPTSDEHQTSADGGPRRPVKEWAEVAIGLPLPMDVVGSVMKALGIMWPGAMMSTRPGHLVVRIPNADRKAKGSQRTLRKALVTSEDPENEADLLPGRGDEPGEFTVSVPEPAAKVLANLALEMLDESKGLAVNYVEQTLTYRDKRLVVIACWSPQQTPHELRLVAEQRAAGAEAEVARLRARLAEVEAGA